MTSSAVKREMVRALNTFAFSAIWNEIGAEYRVNLRLTPVNSRFVAGNVTAGFETIPLPATGLFAVYEAPIQLFFNGLPIAADSWANGETLMLSSKVLLMVYQAAGKLLPRSAIWVYRSGRSNRVLFAFAKAPFAKILGVVLSVPLYVTLYRDSDAPNDFAGQTVYVNPLSPTVAMNQIATTVAAYRAINAAGTTVLVNGVEQDAEQTLHYAGGDYVEILRDDNVVGAYTVNVSNSLTGFYSARDRRYKEILHCPKALNPNNRLITHNTCSAFVRSNTSNKGVYLHRTEATSVGQLTHNDLSADTQVIDALRGHLGESDVSVHVRVRTHSKDNVLIEELSHLALLYSLDDAAIMRCLRGVEDEGLSFWTAPALEANGYLRLMFETPSAVDEALLQQYVEALGYPEVAALLASHQYHGAGATVPWGQLALEKPFVLTGVACRPMLALNGRKLRDDQILHRDVTSTVVAVRPKDEVVYTSGQRVEVCLLEDGSPLPYRFTPSFATPSLTVPMSAVQIFEEVALADPLVGWTIQANHVYKPRVAVVGTLMIEPVTGGVEVVFGPSQYGKTFLIQNARFAHCVTVELDPLVTQAKPLVVAATLTDADNTVTLPLLGHRTLELYLNNTPLVAGVDYTATPLGTEEGVGLLELVIGAREMLVASGNRLEIVAHTNATLSYEVGYVVDNKLSYDKASNPWYAGLSRVIANGRLLGPVVAHGTYLTPASGTIPTGRPYAVHTTLPGAAADALADFTATPDTTRLAAIDRYFGRTAVVDLSRVVIDGGNYRLYSPYLAAIVWDVLNGRFQIADDPSDQRFLTQFGAYDYLKQRDAALVPASLVNPRFVDVQPLYTTATTGSATTRRLLLRLAALVLPRDPDTLGDVEL